MSAAPTPVLFYSYSHRDEPLKERLDAHLSGLQRAGLITTWHDRKIAPGADWATEIDDHIGSADIILLLVSADFLASDYCWGTEVARALDRHTRGEAIVVPVIIRPVDWRSTPLGTLQALPRDGRAITSWSNRDKAWTDVIKGLRSIIETPQGNSARESYAPARGSSAPVEFAHISVPDGREPRWAEHDHGDTCEFGGGCARFFGLVDLVTGADLFFDVVLLNNSGSPAVLSAVGVEIVEIKFILYAYGFPEPAKIGPAKDEYEITMPDLWSGYPQGDEFFFGGPVQKPARQVTKRLVDPVYLPARAPYRYVLHLKDYQNNIPNHARLRLTADVGPERVTSPLLHVHTK